MLEKNFEKILQKVLFTAEENKFFEKASKIHSLESFQALLEEQKNNIDITLVSRDNNKILTHMWGHMIGEYYKALSRSKAPKNFMVGCILHTLSNLYPRSLQKSINFTIKRKEIKEVILNLSKDKHKRDSVEHSFNDSWNRLVKLGIIQDLTSLANTVPNRDNFQEDSNDYDIDPIKMYDYVDSIDKKEFVKYGDFTFSLYSLLVDSPMYKQERTRRLKEQYRKLGPSNYNYNYPVELEEDTIAEESAKELLQVIYPDKKD